MIKNVLLKVRIAAQNRKLVFNLSLVSKPQFHLALGLSPTIHFLIRLLPPLVLFSQISSLTFPSSLACTCKLSISHHAKHPLTHTHTERQTLTAPRNSQRRLNHPTSAPEIEQATVSRNCCFVTIRTVKMEGRRAVLEITQLQGIHA